MELMSPRNATKATKMTLLMTSSATDLDKIEDDSKSISDRERSIRKRGRE